MIIHSSSYFHCVKVNDLNKLFIQTAKDILFYLVMCVATFLMLRMIIGYASFDTHYEFLSQKQEYIHIKEWLYAFYIHVFTSLFTLIAGFTQFSSYILVYHKKLHKAMGRLYVYAVLLINFPTGFIMAIYASGLWPSKLAFIILDSLWFLFTCKAFITAKQGDFMAHKQYMIRSYALTFSAITLRTWRIIISALIVINPLQLYMIDAWMGFVPNLLLAEWIIRRKLY